MHREKQDKDKRKKLIEKVDYSPKAEAFRIIRTNIEFMLQKVPKNRAKIIFVTSTIAQEGKSHTSVNLARSFSFSESATTAPRGSLDEQHCF